MPLLEPAKSSLAPCVLKSCVFPFHVPLIRDCLFTAIDFESAGAARGATDHAVQVGLACWSMTQGHHQAFVSYLRCDQPITWSARKIHGIGPEKLVDAPALLELWPDLQQRLAGAVAVAHARGTEKRFLRAFPGHGFGPWVDTLLLARAAWPEHGRHSLGTLCDTLGVSGKVEALIPGRQWHDALYDATASLVLLEHLIAGFDLADQPLEVLLQPDNRAWHRARRQ